MTVKQKPEPKIVKVAARDLHKPNAPTIEKKMSARILDDQRNAPQPHKPTKKKS